MPEHVKVESIDGKPHMRFPREEALERLLLDMWEFGFGCNSGANDAWAWHERTDELEDRMRELGVVVDG